MGSGMEKAMIREMRHIWAAGSKTWGGFMDRWGAKLWHLTWFCFFFDSFKGQTLVGNKFRSAWRAFSRANNCCANKARVNLEVWGVSSVQVAHGHPGGQGARASSTGAGSSLWFACALVFLSCLGPFSWGALLMLQVMWPLALAVCYEESLPTL